MHSEKYLFYIWDVDFKIKKAGGLLLSRRRATIIGAVGLDFRVRDGNGYGTHAMATGNINGQCVLRQRAGKKRETLKRGCGKGRDNMAKPRGLLVRLG